MWNPTGIATQEAISLAIKFKGEIISADHYDYDEARLVWNGMIDKYPALIVRPLDTDDVIAAVKFARLHDLLVSVRGGGHNVAGHATNDDGMVIDLSAMKHIDVDPLSKTARAEGGVTWGELDAATQVYGLATPGGVVSKTGIAGLTLGGGFGWLRSKYGLTADNLIGAELVTADGRLLRVNDYENADLIWALRGGGGNFGIVTAFHYQLYPVGPEVMFAYVAYDTPTAADMQDAVRFYRDFSATAPDEVSTLFALGQVPPHDHYPVELHGRPIAVFGGLYAGSPQEGQKALQPFVDYGTPLVNASGIIPYVAAQQALDAEFADGQRYYWKSLNIMELNEAAIERIVEGACKQVSPYSTTDLWHIGGEVKRVDAKASAFNGRGAAFLVNVEANWHDKADDHANMKWVREFIHDIEPFSDGSRYLNFAGFQEEGDEMMRNGFGKNYARLAAIKRQYDPTNFFRLNQNIKPE